MDNSHWSKICLRGELICEEFLTGGRLQCHEYGAQQTATAISSSAQRSHAAHGAFRYCWVPDPPCPMPYTSRQWSLLPLCRAGPGKAEAVLSLCSPASSRSVEQRRRQFGAPNLRLRCLRLRVFWCCSDSLPGEGCNTFPLCRQSTAQNPDDLIDDLVNYSTEVSLQVAEWRS